MNRTIIFYIVLGYSCFNTTGNNSFAQDNISVDTFPKRCLYVEQRIFELVNEYRTQNGLTPVIWSERVYQAASNHALYLSKVDNISHAQTKDVSNFKEKKGFIERISTFFPNPSMVGEIIISGSYWGFTDSAYIKSIPVAMVDGWKESKGHNEVILTGGYEYGAVAVFKDEKRGIKPVFVFIRR